MNAWDTNTLENPKLLIKYNAEVGVLAD